MGGSLLYTRNQTLQQTNALTPALIGIFSLALWLMLLAAPAHGAVDIDVRISGVSGELLDNVRAYLSIEQQRNDPSLSEGRMRRLHRKATQEIRRALEPYGYYSVEVDAALTHTENRWQAAYRVDLGPPVRVNRMDVQLTGTGTEDAEFTQLLAALPLRAGDVLEHRRYENIKAALQRLAAERGYFEFRLLAHEVRVEVEANTAEVTLHADTGPRYRFGQVNFHQDVLRPQLLARYVTFKPGEPYHTNALLNLQTALFDSDYFSNVEIDPRSKEAVDEEVPIDVTLTPRPQHRYSVGAGYGTDTGPRARLGWDNRRINQRGHRFGAEYRISEIRESLGTRYRIPIRDPRTDEVAVTTSWTDDHPDISSSEIFLVGVSRTLGRSSGWLESIYLNYQTERFSVGGEPTDQVKLLMPGITYAKVVADNRVYPLRGWRLWLDTRGAHPDVVSDVKFLQLRGQAKWIQRLYDNGRLLLRGNVGSTYFTDADELPASLRFFAGGDQSVRGYAYNSLGPNDPTTGRVVGGDYLLVGSVEVEHRFTEKFSGALFFDKGNALDDFSDALMEGAGFGVRWRSPIGPIRLDIAWALSTPGTPVRLHLSVGPDL